jgi:hypothetical protein
MPGRVHQNDAPALSLASSLAAGATTIPVNQSITGVETPISYTINSGGANQEIVTLVDKNTSTTPSQFENCVRGCDGTADQSHSSGEVLTHEATARDFVDSDVVYSNAFSPSSRLIAYDDFRRSDRGLSGDTLPSDQTWETRQENQAEIIDEQATLGGTGDSMLLWPNSSALNYHRVFLRTNDGPGTGVVLAFKDTSNYVYVTVFNDGGSSDIKLIKVVSGSATVIKSGSIGGSRWARQSYVPLEVSVGRPSFPNIMVHCFGATVGHDPFNTDIQSLIETGSTHVGLIDAGDGGSSLFENYTVFDTGTY